MKDIMGAALLGELLAALARSAPLRKSLGGVAPDDADALLGRLVTEVERLATEGVPDPPASAKKPALYATPPRKPFPAPEPVASPVSSQKAAPPVKEAPVAPSLPASPRTPEPPAEQPKPFPVPAVPVAPSAGSTRRPTPQPKPSPVEKASPAPPVPAPPAAVPTPAPAVVPPPPPVRIAPAPELPRSSIADPTVRVPVTFETDQAFVLAASLIPLHETPSPAPFAVGMAGVEQGSDVFAFDHAGIRFFLSGLKSQEASVSRTGVLLLGKQESIRHRHVHEQLVNALRLHALILPAEAGTVVFGRHDLVRRVDFRVHALFEILLGLSSLTTWRVNAYVLDAHVQKMLPAEPSTSRAGRHDAERGRGQSTAKKTDIKTLERLLNREKKLAEAILQKLADAADSHTVEAMVNLGSGSVEDWKPILKAAFEVPPVRFQEFARSVVECHETHAMFDPMLSVVGGPGSFSLSM